MNNLKGKFGWSIITSKIDDQKDPGNNPVKIFMSMSSLKLEHVKKQAYQYWGPADGNDFPDVLTILGIDPDTTVNDLPSFFLRFRC